MRNLVAVRRGAWRHVQREDAPAAATNVTEVPTDAAPAAAPLLAANSGEQQVYVLQPSSGRIDLISTASLVGAGSDESDALQDINEPLAVLSDEIPCPDESHWQWMSYVAELDALVCGATGGALAVVDVTQRDAVEEMGTMDGGIRGMAWSSNQETLAVATGVGTLLIMNTDWQVLHETHLQAHLPDGWMLTDGTETPSGGSARIGMSWREDGQFLTVNVAAAPAAGGKTPSSPTAVTNKVLIFTNELALHAVGRLEDGRAIPHLGNRLHWCPNHSLIASFETRRNQLFVVFFERNGLRHGELALPPVYRASVTSVMQLAWNIHSDVLAVHLQVAEASSESESVSASGSASSHLLLWTRGNYHWYLKQDISFACEGKQLHGFAWHEEQALSMYYLVSTTMEATKERMISAGSTLSVELEEFTWDVCKLNTISSSNQSQVVTAVIDGSKLLLTPLHRALVPPPMALATVHFTSAITSVVFDHQRDLLLVLLTGNQLAIVEHYVNSNQVANGSEDVTTTKRKICYIKKSLATAFQGRGQLLHLQAGTNADSPLTVVAKTGVQDALIVFSMGPIQFENENSEPTIAVLPVSPTLMGVRRVSVVIDSAHIDAAIGATVAASRIAVQTSDGRVHTMQFARSNTDTNNASAIMVETIASKLTLFHRFQAIQRRHDARVLVVGLSTATAKLYVDDALIAPRAACSSFAFCPFASVLLYTTLGSSAQLCFVPFSTLARASLLEPVPANSATQKESESDQAAAEALSSRVIERGARLVAIVGDRASVILQMPRGNLEGISPRLLVLARAVKHIECFQYAEALEFVRRHRLDLNLLVDRDPVAFTDHMQDGLVNSLLRSRPPAVVSDRLCLFLTNLHVVNVWTTKFGPQLRPYRDALVDAGHERVESTGKVNRVCQEMMQIIERLETEATEADASSNVSNDALLLPYLTAAVKQSPPQYERALHRVQLLLPSNPVNSESQGRDLVAAKRAVKHLMVLTQIDTLVDQALALYDLPLVRFLASYSQRDPKEYVPFLDEMSAITDEDLRRFRIDKHLNLDTKALKHLQSLLTRFQDKEQTAQFENEVMTLVERSHLYDQALALFPGRMERDAPSNITNTREGVGDNIAPTHNLHTRVLMLKAGYLAAKEQFEDAAYVYLAVEDYGAAMRAFQSARVWSMALSTASRYAQLGHLDDSGLQAFAVELARMLLSQKEVTSADVVAAARIYCEYGNNVDDAIALLVQHKLWDESVRVAYLHNRTDLVETEVEAGVLRGHESLMHEIAQRQREYVEQWRRLSTIREQKRLFKLHGIDGSRWDERCAGDTDSVASRGGASSAASSAISAASSTSSLRSVGSHNSAVSIGNFAMKGLAAATSSHFYATQSLAGMDASALAASKSKRYGGMPSRQERHRRRRIKAGSVEEEQHVYGKMREYAPNASLRTESRDVLRMLVFFGHSARGDALQARLAAFETLLVDQYPFPEAPAVVADQSSSGLLPSEHTIEETTAPDVGNNAVSEWRSAAFAP